MPTFSCGSPWRMSVAFLQASGSRLARQTLLAVRSCANAGPRSDGDADDVARFDFEVGAETDRLPQVRREDLDRSLPPQVVAGRVGAADAAEDRQARLRRGAEEAVEEGPLAAGRLRQGQRPGSDLAVVGDEERQLVWPLLTWKPVTLPTAWQGRSGQEGSGSDAVWPRITVVLPTFAVSLLAARPTRSVSAQASRPKIACRPLRVPAAASAACEILHINACSSLSGRCLNTAA